MGRIAEALRKAEQERQQRLTQSGREAGAAVADPPNLDDDYAPSTSEYVPVDAPQGPVAISDGVHESVVPYYDRSSIIAEQYRSLRTRLLTQNPQNDHRVLAVTSAIPREGKSVTTVNLGMIMSEIRHFKILVRRL